jgi:CRP-like cAMP-binding protein
MTGNHFLDTLEPDDRAAMLSILVAARLTVGEVLVEQGDTVRQVHFPTSAYLANVTLTPTGRRLQTAIIGREGMSGLAPFMADAPCAWQVVCQGEGEALFGSAARIRALMDERPSLRRQLLVLTHFYQAQANQLAVCNALHRVGPRVARWLLTASDLTRQQRMLLTQEDIANSLGVQRTSVVASFGELKREKAIRHRRGWLEIENRPALTRRACSCYRRLRTMAEELGVLPGTAEDMRSSA